MKKTGLPFGTLAQGVSTKIDLLPLIIEPENLMAVILQFESVEPRRIGAEELKHLPFASKGRRSTMPAYPSFQTILTTPNITGSALCMAMMSVIYLPRYAHFFHR
jgi:hypothetical protein